MRHSKRDVLTTRDINNALHVRNVETLYGYGSREPLCFEPAANSKDLFYVQDKVVMTLRYANIHTCKHLCNASSVCANASHTTHTV